MPIACIMKLWPPEYRSQVWRAGFSFQVIMTCDNVTLFYKSKLTIFIQLRTFNRGHRHCNSKLVIRSYNEKYQNDDWWAQKRGFGKIHKDALCWRIRAGDRVDLAILKKCNIVANMQYLLAKRLTYRDVAVYTKNAWRVKTLKLLTAWKFGPSRVNQLKWSLERFKRTHTHKDIIFWDLCIRPWSRERVKRENVLSFLRVCE